MKDGQIKRVGDYEYTVGASYGKLVEIANRDYFDENDYLSYVRDYLRIPLGKWPLGGYFITIDGKLTMLTNENEDFLSSLYFVIQRCKLGEDLREALQRLFSYYYPEKRGSNKEVN